MGTSIRIILTEINVFLCADGIDITYRNRSCYTQTWISQGWYSRRVLSLPNVI